MRSIRKARTSAIIAKGLIRMVFLKNKRAWTKWLKESGLSFQEGVAQPTVYPCFAYTTVRSFGYEELNENYLYQEELISMSNKITDYMIDNRVHCQDCNKVQKFLTQSDKCAAQLRKLQYSRAGI